MNNNSILIIEDDETLNQFLYEYMEVHFDVVYTAFDASKAFLLYKEYRPSAIISDINIPKQDGLELIKKIRERDNETIIVILSAYTEKEKLFKAIELNLLTYLTKPVKSDELSQTVTKIKKLLNNTSSVNISESVKYNLSSCKLTVNNKEVDLTLYEKKFLSLLLQNKGKCVSYEDISKEVYDLNSSTKDSIGSLVKRLRKKVGTQVIINCFNEGYKIDKIY